MFDILVPTKDLTEQALSIIWDLPSGEADSENKGIWLSLEEFHILQKSL